MHVLVLHAVTEVAAGGRLEEYGANALGDYGRHVQEASLRKRGHEELSHNWKARKGMPRLAMQGRLDSTCRTLSPRRSRACVRAANPLSTDDRVFDAARTPFSDAGSRTPRTRVRVRRA